MLTNYNREVQYTVNKITKSHICITYNHIANHTLTLLPSLKKSVPDLRYMIISISNWRVMSALRITVSRSIIIINQL